MSKFREWQTKAGLINERVCNATKEVDPTGKGISPRSLTNFKATGTCHLRTALLLLAAHGEGSETWPPLTLEELDAEGLLERRG
jgi:hypothetical protein